VKSVRFVFIYLPVQRALPSLILLAAISLGTIFFRLGSLPFAGADEPRYARIAQEMHDGGNWITPRLEGKPWLEKPPLYYWITAPFYSIIGSRETAARIAPGLCALISAIAVFWLGSVLYGRLAGFLGAIILLTSLGFASFGRGASTDMPFTCCFTLAMAVLAAAAEIKLGLRVLVAYVPLGLAVLGKGPVAIILAIGIGIFFWLWDERGGIFRRWQIVPGFIISVVISVPWFWLAFKQNGYAFISTFFINHNLARFVTDIHHHSQPVYYYLPVLLGLIFPWTGWLLMLPWRSPIKAIRNWRQWNPGMVFLALWVLVPIGFFSLSDSKLVGYILPSIPPLALILGIRIARQIDGRGEPSKFHASLRLHLVISIVMAIAAPYFFSKEYGGHWGIGLILAIAILVPAIFAFAFKADGKRAFAATALQGLIILIAVAQFAFPVLGSYHSTREIAQEALILRKNGEPIITYRFFHHTLFYYTGYQVAGDMKDSEALDQFMKMHSSSLVVTNYEGLGDLSGYDDLSITLLGEQGNFRLLRISQWPHF
jgi:4-amino-4-deoxy-L-arabinose transferase-like glycosyltransferase